MRKLIFMVAVGVGIAAIVRRLLPAEQRDELQEGLLQVPGAMMQHCMDMMPEDSPPKVMMSSMRRFEEQNDEMATLLREQNKLLKKQNDMLKAAAAAESQS